MRIVQLLPELNEGGVERGTVELNRELVRDGFESIVISNGGKLVPQIEEAGGRHVSFNVSSKNILTLPWRVYRLRKLLHELEPDIIHARSRVPAWLAYLANRSLHLPFVTTVHGFNGVNPYSKIMTRGDHVICVSNAVRQYIMRHYDTDANRITVIPRGIDLVVFNPENVDRTFMKQFSQTYGLQGRFVISAVGRITQLKDIETLIRAVAVVRQTRPDVLTLIVGGVRQDKQNYFQSLQALVAELGLADVVVFTGSQSNVAEIYAMSDVVVSSSKKPETFGRSVAEAIAMNTPVIATNHGGVLDIVQEGVNGFLVEAGDSGALAAKIAEAPALSFDGYGYISEYFSLKQMVEKTEGIYRSLA